MSQGSGTDQKEAVSRETARIGEEARMDSTGETVRIGVGLPGNDQPSLMSYSGGSCVGDSGQVYRSCTVTP